MAKGEFKCPRCDRTFSMAAHLARHNSTTHAPKGRKKRAKKKTRRRKAKRKVGRPKGTKKKAGKRKARGKVRRGKGKKKVRRAKVARRAARRPLARGTAGLIREMQTHQSQLSAQQADLEAEITAITGAIDAMGAAPAARPARRRRRGRAPRGPRPGSLKDFIARVLRGKVRPMSPAKIADRVKKAGYKTKAKNLPNMVSNALAQTPGVKKAGRGLYRV